jgi:hypothetical protein
MHALLHKPVKTSVNLSKYNDLISFPNEEKVQI